jgi:acyl-CoA synthetase (AMP-forming)/AMP-acid ligase II
VPRRLATSDLGFQHGGQLFVLGRADDTVVLRGRNFYQADVNAVCGRVDGVRAGRVAVFATPTADGDGDGDGTEVVVVAELRAGADTATPAMVERERRLRTELVRGLDLYVTRVAFLSAGTLPVTTSGKVRTAETMRRFRDGMLPGLTVSG